MKDFPIIGLVGVHYIGDRPISIHSGKDEFCTVFTNAMFKEGYRVVRRAFADALKEDLARMLGVTVAYINANKPHFRLMMQGYGTDYCRDLLGQDFWIERLDKWLADEQATDSLLDRMTKMRFSLVITDCRMPNEVAYVKQQGGMVVRVTRWSPADYPVPEGHRSHSSESVVQLPFDHEIENDDLHEFRLSVVRFTRTVFIPAYYEKRRKLGNGNCEGATIPRSFESGGASD